MKAKYLIFILLGLVLRIVLSFSTFHPDIRAFQLGGQLVADGNILNLYDYLSKLSPDSKIIKIFATDLFIYPPLVYFFHGIFNFIFDKIFGFTFINSFLIENKYTFGNILFNYHLLLLKLPYLIFDALGGVYLLKLFNNKSQKWLALMFWIFNPLTLYATYMMGQFDLIPAVFTIIALYYSNNKRFFLAAFFLGFGIAFKIYPLFLLIPLAFFGKTLIKKVTIFLIGLLPYIVTTFPFIFSHGYRSNALAAGQTFKSLYAQLPISGGESIFYFLFILIIFYLYFYYHQIKVEKLWKINLIVLLIFFIFTHAHPQWFIWLVPFAIIDLVENFPKKNLLYLLLLFSFFASLFFFNSSQTVALFAPIWPHLYESTTIWKTLGLKVDYNFGRSIIQTIFASSAVYLIYENLQSSKFENE